MLLSTNFKEKCELVYLFVEVANRKKIGSTKWYQAFLKQPPFKRSVYFYVTITEDFERFYYSAFQTRFFFGKQKTGVLFFSLKYYNLKLNISTQNCSDRSECEDKYNREYKMDLSQRTEFCHYRANICWSSRRHEDVFKACLEDVFNTSSAYQF